MKGGDPDAALQSPATRNRTQQEIDGARVNAALAGDELAISELLDAVTPVVQARVARALLRRSQSRGRDVAQEVADMTQEVFLALFASDAKALRAWEPSLGLSLVNFIGLLAERRVASLMRVKRRTLWSDSEQLAADPLDGAGDTTPPPDSQVGSRLVLERLLEHLRATLSPRGLDLFYRLYVDEQSVDEVGAQLGLSSAAVYQWKSRLGQAARAALTEIEAERTVPGAQRPAAANTNSARAALTDDEAEK